MDLALLDEWTVGAEEIDRLGHMSVRFYVARNTRAHGALLALPGFAAERRRAEGVVIHRVDSFARFHREQRLGAALQTRGGFASVGETSLRAYCEICNGATGDVAATFVTDIALEDRASRAPRALPDDVRRRAEAMTTSLPDYGAPRTLRLVPPRLDLTFEQIRDRVGEVRPGGAVSLRWERTIMPQDCDEAGFLRDDETLMFSHRQQTQAMAGDDTAQPVWTAPDGRRFGWAVMELRNAQFAPPRSGDRLRSIGGIIQLLNKGRQLRRWIFDTDTGRMVGVDETVSLAMDLGERRAMEIPPDMRAELSLSLTPDFA